MALLFHFMLYIFILLDKDSYAQLQEDLAIVDTDFSNVLSRFKGHYHAFGVGGLGSDGFQGTDGKLQPFTYRQRATKI
jgi:hypothetical protein